MSIVIKGTPGAIPAPPAFAGHLGQGISYPPTFDGNGRLKLSIGVNSVLDSISSICQTQAGERAMQPDYGAGGLGVFEPSIPQRLAATIRAQIEDHEPRVSSVDVKVRQTDENGTLFIDINFVVAGEANSRTLTFPFYQEQ